MKAVAIPYVIALVLGVIIIGVIGYWFVSQGGKTVGVGSKAECDAKQSQYCQVWRNNKFELDAYPSGFTWGSCPRPELEGCFEMFGCDNNLVDKCPIGKACYWCNDAGVCGVVCP